MYINNNYGTDIDRIKDDMKNSIDNMKQEMKDTMEKRKADIANMQEDQSMLGKRVWYIKNYFDENDNPNISKAKSGTYYLKQKLIPRGLETLVETGYVSNIPFGSECKGYRSVYLVLDREEPESMSNRTDYEIYNTDAIPDLMRFLRSNDRNVELEGNTIIILDDYELVRSEIDGFLSEIEEEESHENLVDEFPLMADYIDGNTVI